MSDDQEEKRIGIINGRDQSVARALIEKLHGEGSSPVSATVKSCAQAGDEYTALDSRAKIAGDLYRGGQISRVECFRLEMDALLGEDSGPIDYDTEPLPDDPRVGQQAEKYVGVMRGVE